MAAAAAIRVLVIEDDPALQEWMRGALQDAGMRVVTAPNGREALACLEWFPAEVIVTDLVMPVMDGYAFLAAHAQRSGPHAPVLVISAFSAFLHELRERGEVPYLQKPFERWQLVEAVKALAAGAPREQPTIAETPGDETERLLAVRERLRKLPETRERLDPVARRIAAVFEVPICLVSAVSEETTHWLAGAGLDEGHRWARGMARDPSLCTHAVAAQAPLIVQDVRVHPVFGKTAELAEAGVRFYAGVPLITRRGDVLGTLCLVDSKPRSFTASDLRLLRVLSKRLLAEWEWQERRAVPDEPASAFRYLHCLDPELKCLGRPAFEELLRAIASHADEHGRPVTLAGVSVPRERMAEAVDAIEGASEIALVGRLSGATLGVVAEEQPEGLRVLLERAVPFARAVSLARVQGFPGADPEALREIEWR